MVTLKEKAESKCFTADPGGQFATTTGVKSTPTLSVKSLVLPTPSVHPVSPPLEKAVEL